MFTCRSLNNDNHDLYSRLCWEPDESVLQCAFRYRSGITDGEAWSMPSYKTSDTLLSQLLLLAIVEPILFVKIASQARFWSLAILTRIHFRISFERPHLAFTNDVHKRLLSDVICLRELWFISEHLTQRIMNKNHPRLQEHRFIPVLTSNQSVPNTITYV